MIKYSVWSHKNYKILYITLMCVFVKYLYSICDILIPSFCHPFVSVSEVVHGIYDPFISKENVKVTTFWYLCSVQDWNTVIYLTPAANIDRLWNMYMIFYDYLASLFLGCLDEYYFCEFAIMLYTGYICTYFCYRLYVFLLQLIYILYIVRYWWCFLYTVSYIILTENWR